MAVTEVVSHGLSQVGHPQASDRQSDVLDNKQRANFHLSDLISVSGGWNGSVCHPEAQQSYSGEVEEQHWALQVTHMHHQQSEGLVCASLVFFFFFLASNSTEIYITQIESKMTYCTKILTFTYLQIHLLSNDGFSHHLPWWSKFTGLLDTKLGLARGMLSFLKTCLCVSLSLFDCLSLNRLTGQVFRPLKKLLVDKFFIFSLSVNDLRSKSFQTLLPMGVFSDLDPGFFLNGGKWLSAQIMHKQLFCPSKLSS